MGKSLLRGGGNNGHSISTTEIYDPGTRTWTATGSMTTTRGGIDVTLLLDGKVLVAGGQSHGETLYSAEIYDPATGSWSATGSMTTARRFHITTLLPSGKVLVAGGEDGDSAVLSSAEIYDPVTEVWTITGSMITGRVEPATVLFLLQADCITSRTVPPLPVQSCTVQHQHSHSNIVYHPIFALKN